MATMNKNKNVSFKRELLKVFEKRDNFPFIGDDYENAAHKVLFIGNVKSGYEPTKNRTVKQYPSENYYASIFDSSNNKLSEITSKIRERYARIKGVESDERNSDYKNEISFCNFDLDYYNHLEDNKCPKGADFQKSTRAIKKVVEILQPNKVVFVGNQALVMASRNISKEKKGIANLPDFLKKLGIGFVTLPLKKNALEKKDDCAFQNNSNESILDDPLNTLKDIVSVYYDRTFKSLSDDPYLMELDEIPVDDLFDKKNGDDIIEGVSFNEYFWFRKLKEGINKIETVNKSIKAKGLIKTDAELRQEDEANRIKRMVDWLEKLDCCIAEGFVPDFLSFLSKKDVCGALEITENFVRSFNQEEDVVGRSGASQKLNMAYRILNSSGDSEDKRIAQCMKNRIFVGIKNRTTKSRLVDSKDAENGLYDHVAWVNNSKLKITKAFAKRFWLPNEDVSLRQSVIHITGTIRGSYKIELKVGSRLISSSYNKDDKLRSARCIADKIMLDINKKNLNIKAESSEQESEGEIIGVVTFTPRYGIELDESCQVCFDKECNLPKGISLKILPFCGV